MKLCLFCREMLEKSSAEMKQTVEQLEKRIDSIDTEGMINNSDTVGSL